MCKQNVFKINQNCHFHYFWNEKKTNWQRKGIVQIIVFGWKLRWSIPVITKQDNKWQRGEMNTQENNYIEITLRVTS